MNNLLNYNVLIYDYSGYGKSAPNVKPTHAQLRADMECVMEYAFKMRESSKCSEIILYGHSIGGAVAVDYLSRHKNTFNNNNNNNNNPKQISMLILENTIFSLRAAAEAVLPQRVSPFVPFLIPNVWDNHSLIKGLTLPTLFIVGLQDELVPSQQSRSLFENIGLEI